MAAKKSRPKENDIARCLFMEKYGLDHPAWWNKENSLTSETRHDFIKMARRLLIDFDIRHKIKSGK